MSEKKVVSRKIAIILGLVCIILAVGLVAVFAYDNSVISGLQGQVNDLNSIIRLEKSDLIVESQTINQGARSESVVKSMSIPYSGYLHVSSTSTTDNAYFVVQYWFKDRLYSQSGVVGTSGELVLAVLKSDSCTIYVGNKNWVNGATHTVTVTYYY
jgi:predicted PurR-regulated permease PerM